MDISALNAFFAVYADAFARGDGDAVANLWHTPSFITDARGGVARVTAWTEDEPMRANMRSLCAVYAKAGEHRWSFVLRHAVPMGSHHAFVVVVWSMRGAGDTVIQRFSTGYQVARFAEGLRVVGCTAYSENLDDFRERHAPQ